MLACIVVAIFRARVESHANRVELAMDFTDFDALARSYDYNPAAFLVALRRAGLTSLALTEELGANVGDDGKAYVTTGAALVNQSRVSPIRDPLLAQLVASHRIRSGAVYLLVSDAATYQRYRAQLALHFMPRSVRVLRATRPWLIEVRTQIDYFNALALGIRPTKSRWLTGSRCWSCRVFKMMSDMALGRSMRPSTTCCDTIRRSRRLSSLGWRVRS